MRVKQCKKWKTWRLQKPHLESLLPIHAILASSELCFLPKTSKESQFSPSSVLPQKFSSISFRKPVFCNSFLPESLFGLIFFYFIPRSSSSQIFSFLASLLPVPLLTLQPLPIPLLQPPPWQGGHILATCLMHAAHLWKSSLTSKWNAQLSPGGKKISHEMKKGSTHIFATNFNSTTNPL